jgi:hypothetical protein
VFQLSAFPDVENAAILFCNVGRCNTQPRLRRTIPNAKVVAHFLNSLKRFSAALVIVAVFVGSGLPILLRTWSGRKIPDDFLVVYDGARAMSNHVDIYAGTGGMYIYSPFLAFIFQPLATLSERAAAIVWLALSGSIIFAAPLIAARSVTPRWRLHKAIFPSRG